MNDEDHVDDHHLDEAQAEDSAEVVCPYCGELVEIALDPGGDRVQEYVQDCDVCCRPWMVRARWTPDGHVSVELSAEDEDAGGDER